MKPLKPAMDLAIPTHVFIVIQTQVLVEIQSGITTVLLPLE